MIVRFTLHQHLLGKPYSSPERSQLPLSSNAGGDAATALNTLKAKLSNSFHIIAHSWAIYKCWNYFEAVVYNLGDLMYLSRI